MLEARMRKQLRDYPLDLTLTVPDGSILVMMGENGAGKSTTLNMLAGLVMPDEGSIRLNGSVVFDAGSSVMVPAEDRRVGYVFQRSSVFPHMTVYENVAFGLRARGTKPAVIHNRVEKWLECLDIGELAGVTAARLSGGQKQRVALARALVIEPALLMLDEPFSGLDAVSISSAKQIIRQCTSDLQIPCVVVTHHVADAQEIGDRICLVSQGKISWEGRAADIPG